MSDGKWEQILTILPVPNICMKGNRVFYKFPKPVDLFEKIPLIIKWVRKEKISQNRQFRYTNAIPEIFLTISESLKRCSAGGVVSEINHSDTKISEQECLRKPDVCKTIQFPYIRYFISGKVTNLRLVPNAQPSIGIRSSDRIRLKANSVPWRPKLA
ncbi:hypothetical protein WA026_007931 [Henosepilachna vigintioctopunctata]|uniref:Uncharacterized protein n=1 Tax=Henosepilachna vigintioctopunctata TaxID=420089 RepID=A0AAW1TPL0_9CUCU